MKQEEKNYTGIWIDHRRAFVVSLVGESTTFKTFESQAGSHTRLAGGSRGKTSYSGQDVASESRYDNKYINDLNHYYDNIIKNIPAPDSIMIIGPGEAKGEFLKRIRVSPLKSIRIVGVETVDKMTDNQIIAYVKEFFNIPQSC